MRIIGLDVGTKTVGVALSDPLGITAQPLNPRYPRHPRLKNNIPNGANHLSLNTFVLFFSSMNIILGADYADYTDSFSVI